MLAPSPWTALFRIACLGTIADAATRQTIDARTARQPGVGLIFAAGGRMSRLTFEGPKIIRVGS